jgi:hypothetical protein
VRRKAQKRSEPERPAQMPASLKNVGRYFSE